ncbi:phosphoglyceromutase [Thioalkalivibrio denitrificans]|uniref:2,3-bisphosphoglycerate-dependent phosphoglycerate mutase n=1 Tax=Thioalkalivibrio denitrificans TaxID=108003 RepID=A0A1V3NTB7_9GAMM|nr:2,3-diphosphoglycerate-dependent phosphoglycerate mutase [Thioalkalivibrio denitrificans]OOG28108.1 phosphoglyceromutase [Thioalkalivibrio denitrificans]
MPRIVLMRHGQSTWNQRKLFTGWVDVDLTDEGRGQATDAAGVLAAEGIRPDLCFTSVQIRAIRTLWIVLDGLNMDWLPVVRDWRLNERHYGALQGFSKAEIADLVGEEQVRIWRRSWDVRPPLLDPEDPRFPGNDPRYAELSADQWPRGESLKDTVDRLAPAWTGPVRHALEQGRTPLIVAHGNSLRGVVKILDRIPDEVIPRVEIPVGRPLLYELDDALQPLESRYLGPVPKGTILPRDVPRS